MKEYKIDENTTYIDYGSSKIIKYAKQDGSSLVVKFRKNCEYSLDYSPGTEPRSYKFYHIMADVYIQKPVKVEEKKAEEKKLSKFEKIKNKLLSKIWAKESNLNNSETPTPKETFSKEVLFSQDISSRTLSDFLTKPIRLEPEYKSINKVLESARQTIITDGYRLVEEAEKQEEAKYAKEEKDASAERIAKKNNAARKLKDFGIER